MATATAQAGNGERQRHTVAVLLAAVLWGTTGTVAHHAPAGSNQALVGLATFGFGALVLLAVDIGPVRTLLRDRSTWPLLLVGAIGVCMYAGFYYWSMDLVGVAIGNVLALGSGPVFAALLELVIERRRVSGGWALATALSVLGITLLSLSAHASGGDSPVLGVTLGLAAGFGYALYSWAGASLIGRGLPSRSVMAGLFVVAAAALLPAFALGHPGPLLSGRGLLVLAYLAVVPMAAAYLLFGYGLRGLSASTATTLALAEPIVATLLATLILHERITAQGWIGLGLIMIGILLIAALERRSGMRAA
ncbi:MAG: EamA family transporter [Micrococcales bacterium]|nr:EamA family transporter [Micrococcales bacterium]